MPQIPTQIPADTRRLSAAICALHQRSSASSKVYEMVSKHLLDSDVLIWLLWGRAETLRRLEALDGPFGVSVISRAEIWAGARETERRQIEELFLSLASYPIDDAVADLAGRFLRQYPRRSKPLELADALIAATAVVHELTLVTYNLSHFPMPDLKLAD